MAEEGASVKTGIAWMLGGLLLTLILMNVLFRAGKGESEGTPSTQPRVDGRTNSLPIISQVQPFSLVNQNGQAITLTNLLGNPWLADIIFTRCPTICPMLTKTMQSLRPAVGENVAFVSLTTDPSFDTPSVLKAFAATNGCDTANWHFLTGSKDVLMQLAVDDLKLAAQPTEPSKRSSPNDLFVHSSLIILVDAKGRMRGHFEYDSTNLAQRVQAALKNLDTEK